MKKIRQVEHLNDFVTVKSLRKYLDEMESTWTLQDEKYLGKFEDTPIRIEYHVHKGIGNPRIYHDGGLGLIFLEQKVKNNF